MYQQPANQSPMSGSRLKTTKAKQPEEGRPILSYYYIRGLCQPIRNLLYHLNIEFQDRRIDKNSMQSLQLDKLESTFNSGLPAYRDQEVVLSDSIAIAIYICNKHNARNLLGRNLQLKAKVNEVLFKYWMEKKKIMPKIAEIIRKTTGYHQSEKGVLIRECLNKLTLQTRFLNFCLKSHQATNGWVLGELTLIDFFFYESCFYISGFFNSYIEGDQKLEQYISFAHKFEELEFHAKHDSRKTKLFFPFKSDNLKEIIVSAWQGDEEQEIL